MYRIIQRFILQKPLLFLIIIGALARILIALCYSNQVSIFNDSESYVPLAEKLGALNLKGYDGLRTPGYPFLLMLSGINFSVVVFIQMILGIISSIFLFKISYKLIHSTALALLNALSISFFLHILFYERAILTEALTLSTLIVCLWYITHIQFFNQEKSSKITYKQSLILGILMAVVFLVRPMFIVITPLVVFCFIVGYRHLRFTAILSRALLLCIPAVMSYQGWSYLNFQNTGYKSVTAFSGINLAQSCVSFVDKANDTHADLRDLYVHKRDSVIAENGDVSMTVWRVYETLKAKENITVSELSQRFDPMTKELIKNNPSSYFKQVGISWIDFWEEYILWNYSKFEYKIPTWTLSGIWLYIQTPMLYIMNVLFLIISGIITIRRIREKRFYFDFYLFCTVLIIGSSIGQALVIYGNNGRFSVPFLPFIIIVISHYLYKKEIFKKIIPVNNKI
ncbi:hypothetical protein [uncultured Dokdonia sp.]|uniref:hypothetical protein n=1 Tax=uncultured Dokdonia sp. TaxID=575653 RepID=UPI00260DFDD8|nr:hypothetical protein [uncultured Dokdonia sp.]